MHARVESPATGPLGHSVLEVLGSLIAPGLCDLVVWSALNEAHLAAIPEDPSRARRFVEQELCDAIVAAVGEQTASFVLMDLAPIIDLAVSGIRRTETDSHERETFRPEASHTVTTVPPPSRREDKLEILVATMASLEELRRHVGPFATVSRIGDAFELFTAIETRRGSILVVIDGYRKAVDLSTVATLMPRVPEGCRLVLWGYEPDQVGRFATMERWSVIDATLDWGELADALIDLN